MIREAIYLTVLEKEERKALENEHDNIEIESSIDNSASDEKSQGKIAKLALLFFQLIYVLVFNSMRGVGIYFFRKWRRLKKISVRFYNKHLSYYTHKLSYHTSKVILQLKKHLNYIVYKLYLFLKFFVDAFVVVTKGYQKKRSAGKGVLGGILGAFAAFGRGVRNNRRIFITWINYALPIVAVVMLVNLVSYVSRMNVAVSVEYNGEHIGYIQNETVFEQAEAKLQQRMTYIVDDEKIDNIPRFSLAVVADDAVKSDLEITDAIIQSSNQDIVKAKGLSIDGIFYGAVEDSDFIEQQLDMKKNKYRTSDPNQTVEFTKDVSLESGLFIAKNIKTTEEMLEIINRVDDQDVYDRVVENDTPIIIAARNNMTLDELVQYNPSIMTRCVIGQQVLVNKSQPFLPVSVISEETYEETIDYTVEYVDSSKYLKGYNVTTREGEEGKRLVTARVERVDGIVVKTTVIDSKTKVIKEPVSKKVTRGTSVVTASSGGSYNGPISSSGFIWPATGGYISSPYGWRGRSFHTGIDYAFRGNGYGKPVYAVAGGTVVFAGWGNSYGYLVKIDHGNGVQTWYGHSSKLLVSKGQVVQQGQQIAKVGSTGRSTGNHVHLEVRIYGSTQNPLNYLK